MAKRRGDEDEFEEDVEQEDDERPSWREIDNAREHPEEKESLQSKKTRTRGAQAAATYRSKLSQKFDEGELLTPPEERRTRKSHPVDPDANEPANRAALIRRIRAATESKQRQEALDAMLAEGERLPDDTSLLATLVDHPDEELVGKILVHMEPLLDRQPLKHKASFIMRLDTLRLTSDNVRILAVVERLLDKLAGGLR